MPRVLVTPSMIIGVPGPYSQVLQEAGFEVFYPPKGATDSEIVDFLLGQSDVAAMIASSEDMNREVLGKSNLRVVSRMGVGYDMVDVPAATDLGIVVTTTPGVLEHSVAEHTIALMLAVGRDLVERQREVHRGEWTRAPMPRMGGKTLGLIGMGRIGKVVVPKAQGLGMTVIATDPYPDEKFAAENNVRLCDLDTLLAEADVVSLHSPAMPETHNLINAKTLAQMKPDAILVNTSRGALVDDDALAEAMRGGHLFGAALDAFKIEPLPTDSPLLQVKNILTCTHMGGLDDVSVVALAERAAQNIVDLYQGRWPEPSVVNPDVRPEWKW